MRPFLSVAETAIGETTKTFSLLSYNILAQCLVRRTLFPYADKTSLKIKFRRANLLSEIEHYNPDVACLQEVDGFDDFWKPHFARLGYDWAYCRGPGKQHGLAILWKSVKFSVVYYRHVDFDLCSDAARPTVQTDNIGQILALEWNSPDTSVQTGDPSPGPSGSDEMSPFSVSSVGDISNISIQPEADNVPRKCGIVITNNHLFWKPHASYERCRQTLHLMSQVAELNEKYSWPVLMCGDFNTAPNDLLYSLITSRSILPSRISELDPFKLPEAQQGECIGAETAAEKPPSETPRSLKIAALPHLPHETLAENFDKLPAFRSAYSNYADVDEDYPMEERRKWDNNSSLNCNPSTSVGEPWVTNFTELYKGTLDYIFIWDSDSPVRHSRSTVPSPVAKLVTKKLLKMPPLHDMLPGLPNRQFSSDHLALLAEFEIRQFSPDDTPYKNTL